MSDQLATDNSFRVTRVGVIVTSITLLVLTALFLPAIQQAREAARRTQLRRNLQGIGLALHNYHDTYTVFPPGGVFNAQGTALHEWTSSIEPYLESSPWYSLVDFHRPWNDPGQIGHFRIPRSRDWSCPWKVDETHSSGVWANHFAANQNLLYRNSSLSLQSAGVEGGLLLVGEANGDFLPLGCPYGWRNVRLNLGTSTECFGSNHTPGTHVLHVDGSVKFYENHVDDVVLTALAGGEGREATLVQVAIPKEIREQQPRWKQSVVPVETDRGTHWLVLRLSPNGDVLDVHIDRHDRPERVPIPNLPSTVRGFIGSSRVIEAIATGDYMSADFDALLQLPSVKRLRVIGRTYSSIHETATRFRKNSEVELILE
ncbi:MAG: DUF1559 domain-containing protein [Planctomycetaceae bacterium]|nr:DUF1559 domain-containing protein [Planctomycetaceae bacterium]